MHANVNLFNPCGALIFGMVPDCVPTNPTACDVLCIADKDCREAMILGACSPAGAAPHATALVFPGGLVEMGPKFWISEIKG